MTVYPPVYFLCREILLSIFGGGSSLSYGGVSCQERKLFSSRQYRWVVNSLIDAFLNYFKEYFPRWSFFAFWVYCNVCVQPPHFILGSILFYLYLLGYFIIYPYFFRCGVAFDIEGSPYFK